MNDLHPHLYADDTQIYGFCAPDEASALQQRTSTCVTQASVCRLSVTFVHPTQAIEIFGNVSTLFGMLAIC